MSAAGNKGLNSELEKLLALLPSKVARTNLEYRGQGFILEIIPEESIYCKLLVNSSGVDFDIVFDDAVTVSDVKIDYKLIFDIVYSVTQGHVEIKTLRILGVRIARGVRVFLSGDSTFQSNFFDFTLNGRLLSTEIKRFSIMA